VSHTGCEHGHLLRFGCSECGNEKVRAELEAAKRELQAYREALSAARARNAELEAELAEAQRGDPDGYLLSVYQVLTGGAGAAADLFEGSEPRYGRVVEVAKRVSSAVAFLREHGEVLNRCVLYAIGADEALALAAIETLSKLDAVRAALGPAQTEKPKPCSRCGGRKWIAFEDADGRVVQEEPCPLCETSGVEPAPPEVTEGARYGRCGDCGAYAPFDSIGLLGCPACRPLKCDGGRADPTPLADMAVDSNCPKCDGDGFTLDACSCCTTPCACRSRKEW